jgi:hypothetical protein
MRLDGDFFEDLNRLSLGSYSQKVNGTNERVTFNWRQQEAGRTVTSSVGKAPWARE